MINRKYFVILLFLIIAIGAISQVSAADVNATDNVASESDEISLVDASDEIIGEEVNDEIAMSDESDSLKISAGTFSDLADLISNGGTISLSNDYIYDPDTDSDYEYGMFFDGNTHIKGNNHIIYANGAKGVFNVLDGDIVFIDDVIFYNDISDSDDVYSKGGAIYNKGYLFLDGCQFRNFKVSYEGGAIYNAEDSILSVENCIFVNNTAFGEDEAAGGAIASYGYLLVNASYFTNCTSEYGGAIATLNNAYITNSIFGILPYSTPVNGMNIALYSGGAIYNGPTHICDVYQCYFSNNRVGNVGGAVYSAHVCDSIFEDDNIANPTGSSHLGHNVYGGVVVNCTQADSNSNNFYNTIESEGFVYESGNLFYPQGTKNKAFEVTVTSSPDGEDISNVRVSIVIDGDDDDGQYYATTDDNGLASFTLPTLSDGQHTIEVSLVHDEFSLTDPIVYDVTVGKVDSEVTFSTNNLAFDYGSTGTATVTLDGATGVTASVLNYPNANVIVNNNIITVSGLDAGSYTLQVVSTPDANHFAVTRTIPITVRKVDSSATFSNALTFDYGSSASTILTVSGGTVQNSGISVLDHPEATINYQSNGITVSGLGAGSYTLQVVTTPDANHNAYTATTPITVNKIKSTISFNSLTFNSLEAGTTTLTVSGGTVQNSGISVLNHPEAVFGLYNNVVTVSGLAAGTYTLSITTTPDANHEAATGTATITVTKPTATIQVNSLSVYHNSGKTWTIKLVDANGNPVANTVVSLNVYTGSSYRPYAVTTNANGVATFAASVLSVGTHRVVLNTQSNVYASQQVSSSVTVLKQSAVKYTVTKESVKGGTALTIKIKINGKYVKGVKFKLLVYTGSKVTKTITLKTKKVKNYCVIGYATNKLSKGYHKVKIVPYDTAKYSGSKVISKAIKITKRGSFERKLTS